MSIKYHTFKEKNKWSKEKVSFFFNACWWVGAGSRTNLCAWRRHWQCRINTYCIFFPQWLVKPSLSFFPIHFFSFEKSDILEILEDIFVFFHFSRYSMKEVKRILLHICFLSDCEQISPFIFLYSIRYDKFNWPMRTFLSFFISRGILWKKWLELFDTIVFWVIMNRLVRSIFVLDKIR